MLLMLWWNELMKDKLLDVLIVSSEKSKTCSYLSFFTIDCSWFNFSVMKLKPQLQILLNKIELKIFFEGVGIKQVL